MEKLLFKCKHCENDDLKHMHIKPIVQPNPDYKPFAFNTEQYINVGLLVGCAKCNKDTVVIIDDFHNNKVQIDMKEVPEQALIYVKFETPEFSAIKYILTDSMKLDQVVVDINNKIFSLITRKEVKEGYREISKAQYEALREKRIEEVKEEKNVVMHKEEILNTNSDNIPQKNEKKR